MFVFAESYSPFFTSLTSCSQVKLHFRLPTDTGAKFVNWELIKIYLKPEGNTLIDTLNAVRELAVCDEQLRGGEDGSLVQKITLNHISAAINDCSTPGHGDAVIAKPLIFNPFRFHASCPNPNIP